MLHKPGEMAGVRFVASLLLMIRAVGLCRGGQSQDWSEPSNYSTVASKRHRDHSSTEPLGSKTVSDLGQAKRTGLEPDLISPSLGVVRLVPAEQHSPPIPTSLGSGFRTLLAGHLGEALDLTVDELDFS